MVNELGVEAFALAESGDVSKPIRSPYGWHIIKKIDKRGTGSFESRKSEIMKRIARDERANKGQESLIEKLKVEYNVAFLSEGEALLSGMTKDFFPMDSVYMAEATTKSQPLLRIADKVYTTSDFASFMKTNKRSTKKEAIEVLNEKKEQFLNESVLAYEDTQLERK